MDTYSTKISDIKREWHLVDASNQVLGRLSTRIASLLQGKHKTLFCRHLDCGDFVVVLNAEKIKVTGKKARDKIYYWHSNYPGGFKSISFNKLMETHPERAIEYAVRGMLPHNRVGRAMFRRLKVYAGTKHPHEAQLAARKEVAAGKDKGESGE